MTYMIEIKIITGSYVYNESMRSTFHLLRYDTKFSSIILRNTKVK